jgi:hypothetical protein
MLVFVLDAQVVLLQIVSKRVRKRWQPHVAYLDGLGADLLRGDNGLLGAGGGLSVSSLSPLKLCATRSWKHFGEGSIYRLCWIDFPCALIVCCMTVRIHNVLERRSSFHNGESLFGSLWRHSDWDSIVRFHSSQCGSIPPRERI